VTLAAASRMLVRTPRALAAAIGATGLTLVLTGCADRGTAVVTGPPAVQAASMAAYLSVSTSSVVAGDELTVSGNVRLGAGTPRVGSYLARVSYDPTLLRFMEEVPVEGGARALNAEQGRITVAGASADGIASERLFAVRFKVLGPAAMATLVLDVQELNDASFAVRTTSLQRKRALVLDALGTP
jgi:hypothetical protein